MVVKCELKQGVGKKSNKPYVGLFIELPNGFKKVVFPQNDGERFAFEQALNMD